jgi:hypothetical protein
MRPVCNVESRCSVHRICRCRVGFEQPYRTRRFLAPMRQPVMRPSRPSGKMNSPASIPRTALISDGQSAGRLINLAILASFSILTPRRLRVQHSGAFCINGIAQRPSLDAILERAQEQDRSVYRLSIYNSDQQRAAARFASPRRRCSQSQRGRQVSRRPRCLQQFHVGGRF